MSHPLTNKRIYLFTYILIWIILGIIQIFILMVFFKLSFYSSFIDSMVSSILHGMVGLAIWYPVRFNPLSPKNFFTPLLNITTTGLFTVFVWIGLSFLILKSFFRADVEYVSFLQRSIPNRIITDSLLYTLLVMVYSLIVYSSNLKEKVNSEGNLRSLVKEAELAMLKTQINPHFLFNSLNSISLLIKIDPGKAREMVVKLSEFLRYSLRYNESETIQVTEEMDNISRYLEIEKIRFGDKMQYIYRIEPQTQVLHLPNMILQPLFENAIKHGVYESTDAILIELDISMKGKNLNIELKNNFDTSAIPVKGTGIGLKNISERLKLIYGRTDLLNYSIEGNSFIVKLIIPQKSFNYND